MSEGINIYTPGVPRHSQKVITQTQWEDFVCDPVFAAWVIFNIRLDAFQAARLRLYWWVMMVMDSSGYSSGKTIVDFIFSCLRAILIPDQRVGVYYPIFDTGKNTFWPYFRDLHHPMFRAQLGDLNEAGEVAGGDGKKQSGGFYEARFRNGNNLIMPAPSMMKDASTQGSMRFNTLLIEEWTGIDESSNAINAQLLGRASRQNWCQDHPVWGNHILLTAPAKTRMHPAYQRYKQHKLKVDAGDPNWCNLHYSFKDYSNLPVDGGVGELRVEGLGVESRNRTGKSFKERYRDRANIKMRQAVTPKAEWLGDGFGIWAASGVGWYTEEALLNCIEAGRRRGLRPVLSRAEMEAAIEN